MTREQAIEELREESERYRELGTAYLSWATWMTISIVIEVGDASLLEMIPTAVRLDIDHIVAMFKQEGHVWVYPGAEAAWGPGPRDEGETIRRLSELIDQAGTSTLWRVFRQQS